MPVERVEVLDAARVGDGDERVELPEVLDRERDPLLVRERPEDVGGDGAAEVGVQLGEAVVEHRAELTQVTVCYLASIAAATKACSSGTKPGSIVCGSGYSR